MRRIVTSVVWCGIAGIAVTWGVAWGLAAWPLRVDAASRWRACGEQGVDYNAKERYGAWSVQVYERVGAEAVWSIYSTEMSLLMTEEERLARAVEVRPGYWSVGGIQKHVDDVTPAWAAGLLEGPLRWNAAPPWNKGGSEIVVSAGWPWPAVMGGVHTRPLQKPVGVWAWLWQRPGGGQWPENGLLDEVAVLGWRPRWAGLAGDVLVYGSGLWVLTYGVGAVRRWRRRRAGRCERCGYDLRGGEGACVECGAA